MRALPILMTDPEIRSTFRREDLARRPSRLPPAFGGYRASWAELAAERARRRRTRAIAGRVGAAALGFVVVAAALLLIVAVRLVAAANSTPGFARAIEGALDG